MGSPLDQLLAGLPGELRLMAGPERLGIRRSSFLLLRLAHSGSFSPNCSATMYAAYQSAQLQQRQRRLAQRGIGDGAS
jgi:hypothetical protein